MNDYLQTSQHHASEYISEGILHIFSTISNAITRVEDAYRTRKESKK